MEKQRVLSWLGRRRSQRKTAAELYGAVVTAARQSWFYEVCGVPDTPEGRFEMVALHLAPLLCRLSGEGTEVERLARLLTESFVSDMDACMREMGVGDLAVPKKVKAAASALAERTRRFKPAPRKTNEEIARDLMEILPDLERAEALADYVRRAARHLEGLTLASLFAGALSFPPPEEGSEGQIKQ